MYWLILLHSPVFPALLIAIFLALLFLAACIGIYSGRRGAEDDLKRILGKDYDPDWKEKRNGTK